MRSLTVMVFSLLFTGSVLASQCPRLVHQIDQQLASSSYDSATQAQVMALRDQGQALHQQGKHGESVEVLKQAVELLNSEQK
ncbi:hypothetical protein [Marinobacter mobilis]|uniref:Tetratricopeptide repeat-containing protein n=1 Tax=Marinobacter mobilis TaxID=488533 RepID=A0A1H2SIF2_9GAMM|nr:hypothetical protein [Marinobacter mobilis]SDW31235.1 hypothetical protein SAMN04487960_102135 [Marinobacter mobilis]